MDTWEEELDLDVSDIWASASKTGGNSSHPQTEVRVENLAVSTEPAAPPRTSSSQLPPRAEIQPRDPPAIPPKLHQNLDDDDDDVDADADADAEIIQANLNTTNASAEPQLHRRRAHRGFNPPSQVPSAAAATRELQHNLPQIPPAVHHHHNANQDRNPVMVDGLPSLPSQPAPNQPPRAFSSKERPTSSVVVPTKRPDIRKYFPQRGSSPPPRSSNSPQRVSFSEGPPRKKKSRIPGPVGDLLLQDDEGVALGADGKGKAVMSDRDDGDDEAFRSGPWLSALHSLNVEDFDPGRYAILKVTVSRIKASKIQQVQNFVAVIKELTSNVFGDAMVSLKDPTGTVSGIVNKKVFSDSEFGKVITPGAVIILKKVAIFTPLAHYINITTKNVVKVFPADLSLPQEHTGQQQQPTPTPSLPPQMPPQMPPQPPPPSDDTSAAAAKLAGWDLTADMEALLNDDADDFYS